MKQTMQKQSMRFLAVCFLLAMTMLLPFKKANAAAVKPAAVGRIDYDALTMEVLRNNNNVIYYSMNRSDWFEVEGYMTLGNSAYVMDIGWVSSTTDTPIYLKGDIDPTIVSVTLPAKDTSLQVTYDKIEEDFTFENCEEAVNFQWRKSTDYNWHGVSLDTSSASYRAFLSTMQDMLVKGAKVIFRIPQTIGTSEDTPGSRPSKEVTITLTKRANAPGIVVNSSKLTLNTTDQMEYYNESEKAWIECDKTMSVQELAPKALYVNGSKAVTVKIRTAATTSKSYSKTATIVIPGQEAAPTIGSTAADVSYYYQNKKLVLVFNHASASEVYSYAVVRPGESCDVTKASFVSVNTSSPKMLSQTKALEGCTIYVRKQGTNANSSKGILLRLSSETAAIRVSYK